MATRRTFSSEFKSGAVRLIKERDVSVAQVADVQGAAQLQREGP
jgi:transposase-like protein